MITKWYGSYTTNYKDKLVIDDKDYIYKINYSLLRRIGQYAIDSLYWQKGDFICDPIAGIGTTAVALADKFRILLLCQEERLMFTAKKNITHNSWINETNIKNCVAYQPYAILSQKPEIQEVLIEHKIKTNLISGFIFCPPWLGIERINDYKSQWQTRFLEMYYSCNKGTVMIIVTNEINANGNIIKIPNILQSILLSTQWKFVEEIHSYFAKDDARPISMFAETEYKLKIKPTETIIDHDVILIYRKV